MPPADPAPLKPRGAPRGGGGASRAARRGRSESSDSSSSSSSEDDDDDGKASGKRKRDPRFDARDKGGGAAKSTRPCFAERRGKGQCTNPQCEWSHDPAILHAGKKKSKKDKKDKKKKGK